MAMTERPILGVFDEPAMADQAMDALQTAGFRGDHIHVSAQHASAGFLAGLKNFFGGTDDAASAMTDDLTGMGVSREEAQYYENEHQAGHTIVAVQAEGREPEAMDILRTTGASFHETGHGTTASPASASTLPTPQTADATRTTRPRTNRAPDGAQTDEQRVLRLREEQLTVNKQRVQTGEVDLHKEIVTEQKTVNVPVTHEEAVVERRAVTGATADESTPIGEGESIRVPLSEERVNVSKDTVVTGEVSIGTRAVQQTQQVTESVKKEEARIEQQGDAPHSRHHE